jgi:hypothetical protein
MLVETKVGSNRMFTVLRTPDRLYELETSLVETDDVFYDTVIRDAQAGDDVLRLRTDARTDATLNHIAAYKCLSAQASVSVDEVVKLKPVHLLEGKQKQQVINDAEDFGFAFNRSLLKLGGLNPKGLTFNLEVMISFLALMSVVGLLGFSRAFI